MLNKAEKSFKGSASFLFKIFLTALIAVNLYFASWNVLHGNLYFHTDIGRDFLLLADLFEKKLVLIGQRAGVGGLFHGPAWLYLNLPAFIVGRGSPIVVGYFWVILYMLGIFTTFWVGKKIFSFTVGLITAVLFSGMMIIHVPQMSHPDGAIIAFPLFFYTVWQYRKTNNVVYLFAHVLSAGLLAQFEIAFGLPLIILSFLHVLMHTTKTKKILHLASYFLLVIPLSTFIVFDLRNDFIQLKSFIAYIQLDTSESFTWIEFIKKRIDNLLVFATPFTFLDSFQNKLYAVLFLGLAALHIKAGGKGDFYRTALYFILGFFLLTITNKGGLQAHHALSFSTITFLAFASLYETKYKREFFIIFALIVLNNLEFGRRFISRSEEHIRQDRESWFLLNKMGFDVIGDTPDDFGYFVYGPDTFAYQAKYAMNYWSNKNPAKKGSSFAKKEITYIIAEPPPREQPWLDETWWTTGKIRISSKPEEVFEYANGYKVKRYRLSQEEINIPFDVTSDTGIHFR